MSGGPIGTAGSPTRISVVIPVRDDAVMLEACLRSLATQSRPADEIIVVDNGSTDDSTAVAAAFGAIVLREPSPGIWAAAATGFDHATGTVIARCDADSVLPEDWLARIDGTFAGHPTAVAVTGPGKFYDLAPAFRFFADIFYMRAYFWLVRGALGHWPLFGSNFAIRVEFWRSVRASVHRHDSEVHDDLDLSFHLSASDDIILDNALSVGISGRPFGSGTQFLRRLRRAGHTFLIHGFDQSPAHRWGRRAMVRGREVLSPAGPLGTPDVSPPR